MSKKKDFDKNVVTDLYHVQKKSLDVCSKILNTTRITLTKWMLENEIEIDSDRKFRNPTITFSNNEIEILNGCLLGDGHITKPIGKSCQFTYCSSEYEHVYFVYSHFKKLMVNECVNGPGKYEYFDKRTEKKYIRYEIRSQSNVSFYNLRKLWYPNEIKIVPVDIKLTPTTLLYWYIGDGGLVTGKRYQYIKLSTNAFSDCDLKNLISELESFEPRVYGKSQKVIYLPRHRIKKFLDTIGQCPIKCYEHKWKFNEYKYEGCSRRQDEI